MLLEYSQGQTQRLHQPIAFPALLCACEASGFLWSGWQSRLDRRLTRLGNCYVGRAQEAKEANRSDYSRARVRCAQARQVILLLTSRVLKCVVATALWVSQSASTRIELQYRSQNLQPAHCPSSSVDGPTVGRLLTHRVAFVDF